MDWLMTTAPHIHSTFAAMGEQQGDQYQISDDCHGK